MHFLFNLALTILFEILWLLPVSIKPIEEILILKKWPYMASFSLFSSFHYTVDSKQMFNIIFLPMTGFEPWTSGIGSDRSTN